MNKTMTNDRYAVLRTELASVMEGEKDVVANMANAAALIHEAMGNWWTGFYRVVGDQLVLGPFQGQMACTRIRKGHGVCGTCWVEGRTVVVPNVHEFAGHIACSSASNSEIVVPIWGGSGQMVGVLDLDSREYGAYDEEDARHLEKICALIAL